jgi:hypothetical protein
VAIQRVPIRRGLEARQRELFAFDGTNTRSTNRDSTPAQGDRTLGTPSATTGTFLIGLPRLTTQSRPVVLHHRTEHLLARLDADTEESAVDVFERRQHRER